MLSLCVHHVKSQPCYSLAGAARLDGRYACRWVEEYHVDGFRFDLASCLCRDGSGTPLEVPPIIRDIAKDPVLSKVTTCNSLFWG